MLPDSSPADENEGDRSPAYDDNWAVDDEDPEGGYDDAFDDV